MKLPEDCEVREEPIRVSTDVENGFVILEIGENDLVLQYEDAFALATVIANAAMHCAIPRIGGKPDDETKIT